MPWSTDQGIFFYLRPQAFPSRGRWHGAAVTDEVNTYGTDSDLPWNA